MRSGLLMVSASLVTGLNMATRSKSWKASLFWWARSTPPTSETTGEWATYAAATPVSKLVAPGPLVTRQAPGVAVTRARPSAMNAAACSWRTLTYSMLLSS